MDRSVEYLQKKDIFDSANSVCLKGIAVVMLLMHHCFLSPSRYKGHELRFIVPEHIVNYISSYFKICVCIFVFISAYGITKKLTLSFEQKQNKKTLIINEIIVSRFIKLLGSFVFVFLLTDLCTLYLCPERFENVYGDSLLNGFQFFFIDMLGLAELLGTPTILGTYWYYSLAIIIIIILPLLWLIYKKIGNVLFLSMLFIISFTVEFQNENIWHYLLCIGVGIVCASENTITKLVENVLSSSYRNRVLKLVIECVLLLASLILRQGVLKKALYPVWDAVIPLIVTCFCCEFIFCWKPIRKVFTFLGKHSANIFLVHNYIRKVWFNDILYSLKYPVLIVLGLLLSSLAFSIVIEYLKKILRYDKFIAVLVSKSIRKIRMTA